MSAGSKLVPFSLDVTRRRQTQPADVCGMVPHNAGLTSASFGRVAFHIKRRRRRAEFANYSPGRVRARVRRGPSLRATTRNAESAGRATCARDIGTSRKLLLSAADGRIER